MEDTQDLLSRGIAAAKARSISEARFYLERVVHLNPHGEQRIEALYWLSTLVTDPEQEREVLEMILTEAPLEPRARRRLLVIEGKLSQTDIVDLKKYEHSPDGIPTAQGEQISSRQTGPLSRNTTDGENFIAGMETAISHDQTIDQQILTCGGCGAEFLQSDRMISTSCPFCLSATVVNFNTIRKMTPPARIVPVEVGFPQAFEAARAALSGELEKDDVQNVRPAFFPVWQFEIQGEVSWRIPAPAMSNRDLFSGEQKVDSYIVPVLAVSGILASDPEIALDFDFSRGQPFAPHFLVDCLAVSYQMRVSDAALKARDYTVTNVSKMIGTKLGRRIGDFFIDSSNLQASHFWLTLVPFWMFIDPITDKLAVINGQNGHARTGMREMNS